MIRDLSHAPNLMIRLAVSLATTVACASSLFAVTLVDMNFNGPTGLENPALGPNGVLKDGGSIVGGELRTSGSNAAAGSGLDLPLGKMAYAFSGAADFSVSFDFASIGGSTGVIFSADGAKYLYDTIPGFNPDATVPPAGGQAGGFNIFTQPGFIRADLWFIGTISIPGTFNDDQLHSVSAHYSALDTTLTFTVDDHDPAELFVDFADEGGFLRDTSHDIIRLGDPNNPDLEAGDFGIVPAIAARFDNLLIEGQPAPPSVRLTVNRGTGAMTVASISTDPVAIDAISITSDAGTLRPANYRPVDANNPAFDTDDVWQVTVQNAQEVTEADTAGGANNGATLTLGQNFAIDNGTNGLWKPFFDEDLKIAVFDRSVGALVQGEVEYVGDERIFGDLDQDMDVDLQDYQAFQNGFDDNIAGLSFYDSYFLADLNGDNLHNYEDFIAFAGAYDANNGAGSFNAMLANVPEPSCLILLGVAFFGMQLSRTRRRNGGAALILAALAVTATFNAEIASAAKLVEYPFTTNLSDTSGNNRNGTPIIGFGGGTPSVSSGKLHLSGDTDESVNVPLGAANPFGGTSDYRIEMKFASNGSSFNPDLGMILLGSSTFNSSPTNDDIQSLALYVTPQSQGGDLVVDYWFAGDLRVPGAALLDGAEHSIIVSYAAPDVPGPVEAPNAGTMFLSIDGTWLASGAIAARPPNINTHSVRIGASRNSVFPYQDDLDGELVQVNTEFEGTIDDFRIFNDALEPTQLRAEVDLSNGKVTLLGGELLLTLRYYEINSPGGGLKPGSWNSLEDQLLNQIGTGIGQHWDEAVASPNQLAESFLLGSSQFGAATSISLGNVYQTSGLQDLEIVAVTDNLDEVFLNVTYINAPSFPSGDYNHNGVVDAADYTVWRNSLNQSGPNLAADGDGNGTVNQDDYTYWKNRFGNTSGSGSLGSATVPEPAAALLVSIGICWFGLVRARRLRNHAG